MRDNVHPHCAQPPEPISQPYNLTEKAYQAPTVGLTIFVPRAMARPFARDPSQPIPSRDPTPDRPRSPATSDGTSTSPRSSRSQEFEAVEAELRQSPGPEPIHTENCDRRPCWPLAPIGFGRADGRAVWRRPHRGASREFTREVPGDIAVTSGEPEQGRHLGNDDLFSLLIRGYTR